MNLERRKMADLALRMAEVLRDRDPYGFDDAFDSIESGAAEFYKQLTGNPYDVISQLLDMIEADTI